MKTVKKHAHEQWVALYIEHWLKTPAQEEDGTLAERTSGTPQGGVISHDGVIGIPLEISESVSALCVRCVDGAALNLCVNSKNAIRGPGQKPIQIDYRDVADDRLAATEIEGSTRFRCWAECSFDQNLSSRVSRWRLIEYAHEKTTSANSNFGRYCCASSVRPTRTSELGRRFDRTRSLECKRCRGPEEVLDGRRWKDHHQGKDCDGSVSGDLRSPSQAGLQRRFGRICH